MKGQDNAVASIAMKELGFFFVDLSFEDDGSPNANSIGVKADFVSWSWRPSQVHKSRTSTFDKGWIQPSNMPPR